MTHRWAPADSFGVGVYPRDPKPFENPRVSTLGIDFEAERPEIRTPRGKLVQAGRPAVARILGALGGPIVTADPERLRYEARRLAHAADLLEAQQTGRPAPPAPDEAQVSLFELGGSTP